MKNSNLCNTLTNEQLTSYQLERVVEELEERRLRVINKC